MHVMTNLIGSSKNWSLYNFAMSRTCWNFAKDRVSLFSTALVAIIVQLCLPAAIVPADAARTSTEQVVVFTQRDLQLGHMKVYMGKSGVKITMDNHHCVLVASPPSWRLSYFNPTSKLIYQLDHSQLIKQPLFESEPLFSQQLRTAGPSKAASVHGLPALMFERKLDMTEARGIFRSEEDHPRRLTKLIFYAYVDKSRELPAEAVRFVEALFGLPDLGFPLGMHYYLDDGSNNSVMNTYRKETVTMPASQFAPPLGYKPARSELDVVSSNRTKLMDGWIEDMGLGEGPAPEGKRQH